MLSLPVGSVSASIHGGPQVTVNVPFDLPVLEFGKQLFKPQGNSSVVFAPHEWRGTRGAGGIPGAGGGGWYSNPGDMGRTDVCAAPTW